MNTYLLHSIHSCSSAAYHIHVSTQINKEIRFVHVTTQSCWLFTCTYLMIQFFTRFILYVPLLAKPFRFWNLWSFYIHISCPSVLVEPMIILYLYLLSISFGGTYTHSIFISPSVLVETHHPPFSSHSSVVCTAVGQVVTATDILRLFCLDCLQFWTVCDAMSQASTVGAANLTCNKHTPQLITITVTQILNNIIWDPARRTFYLLSW